MFVDHPAQDPANGHPPSMHTDGMQSGAHMPSFPALPPMDPGSFASPDMDPASYMPPFPPHHLPTPISPESYLAYDARPVNLISPRDQSQAQLKTALFPSMSEDPARQPFFPQFHDGPSQMAQIMTPDASPISLSHAYGSRPAYFIPHAMAAAGPQYGINHAFVSAPSTQQTPTPLAPAPVITSPVFKPAAAPSGLSSPFAGKTSLPPHLGMFAPQRYTIGMEPPADGSTAFLERATQQAAGSMTTPGLGLPQAPFHRTGRLDRPAAAVDAHMEEVENRRPDYLIRAARPDSPSFDRYGDDGPALAGMGIAVSPMKGRRIKLFQETSEESFEQSLMAGGYDKYGSHPARPTTPSMHQRTLEWLEQAKMIPVAATLVSAPSAEEKEPDAKELLKRKRLSAFQPVHVTRSSSSRLRPVDVLGMGRMLLEVPEVDPVVAVVDDKRKGKARKKKLTPAVPPMLSNLPEDSETKGPSWVDAAFPWSLRAAERADRVDKEKRERLRWIEKYLDRDSDDEGQIDDEDDVASEADDDSMDTDGHSFRAQGLYDAPALGAEGFRQGRFVIPGQAADARWQLTKRSVPRRGVATDPAHIPGLICVCKTPDDDQRELVKCDDCGMWYHPSCIGIDDVTDLGGEDELWFCLRCNGASLTSPRTPGAAEPAFYTAHQTPLSGSFADPVLSFAPGLQESPIPSWPASLSAPTGTPTTPVYAGARSGGTSVFSSRSTATTLTDSVPRAAPRTPRSSQKSRDARVLSSPDDDDTLGFRGAYDPLATPSRGGRHAAPFTTPKSGSDWSVRALGVPWSASGFTTPSKRTRMHDAREGSTSPSQRPAKLPSSPSTAVEDSPVVRSAQKMRTVS